MARVVQFLRHLAETGFHVFLAAYWYLVHALYPGYALMGAVTVYVAYRILRPRMPDALPQPALLLLSAVTFQAARYWKLCRLTTRVSLTAMISLGANIYPVRSRRALFMRLEFRVITQRLASASQ